jgi:hypothetical protein
MVDEVKMPATPPAPPSPKPKTEAELKKERIAEMEKVRALDPVRENHPDKDGNPAVNPPPAQSMFPVISNPVMGPRVDPNPELATVEIYRDINGVRNAIKVHPKMVGDYLRAGWSSDEPPA